MQLPRKGSGFTIVELLIVIVIIGILAAITTVAYNGIQDRARQAKIKTDLSTIAQAISLAELNSSQRLRTITGVTPGTSTDGCTGKPDGTKIENLSRTTDPCWTKYNQSMSNISAASGVSVANILDPYGRPYLIYEQVDPCTGSKNWIGAMVYPYNDRNIDNYTELNSSSC